MLSVRLRLITVVHTESSGSDVSMQAWGWLMGFKMFRVRWKWLDVFGNDVHCFRNAIDGSERPGMGLGGVRDCLGGVWTASRHN